MKRAVYVGLKPLKTDNVAGTGLTWTRGEIHEIEDDLKATKLFEHPMIWRDADLDYELITAPPVSHSEPTVKIVSDTGLNSEPILISVSADVFVKLAKKEFVAVFMSNEDSETFADWKLGTTQVMNDDVSRETDVKIDLRTKEYRDGLEARRSVHR